MRVIIGSIDPIYHSPPISTTLRTTFGTGVSCYWYSRILAFGDLCCLRVDFYSSIPSLSRLLSYGRFECILKMSYWSYACTISHQSACLRPTRIAEIVQSCLCPTNIICCSLEGKKHFPEPYNVPFRLSSSVMAVGSVFCPPTNNKQYFSGINTVELFQQT